MSPPGTCPGCAELVALSAVECSQCGARLIPYTPKPAPLPGRGRGRPRQHGPDRGALNGRQRAAYGVTVTFIGDYGPFVLHEAGPPLEALGRVCDRALVIDAEARVRTISTPDTILSDLRGRGGTPQNRMARFESGMLARIGRKAMLAPGIGAGW